MPFPLDLTAMLGQWGSYVVYLFIGIAFGAVLEMAGFAMAFVEDFGIVGQTDDVRRCVDASASESTLAETPGYQSASSEWLGGAVVATYSSAEHDADQPEASAKAQGEWRKQIERGDRPGYESEQ